MNRLDAPAIEPLTHGRITKAGNTNHPFMRCRPARQACQGWTHFAANAENHDVAINRLQIIDQVDRWQTQEGLEVFD